MRFIGVMGKKNKIRGLILLTVIMVIAGCDGLDPEKNRDLLDIDHEYEIDTKGSNPLVYEFTPRNNTNKTCVALALHSGKAAGLQCFDKMRPVTTDSLN